MKEKKEVIFMYKMIEDTVGQLVARRPDRSQVFDRLGIDYCCGGKMTLDEACRKHGLDREDVLRQLQKNDNDNASANAAADDAASNSWQDASLTALTEHIEACHHSLLKKELPRLNALAQKVAAVHGAKDERLKAMASLLTETSNELLTHTMREEKVLFPYIRNLEAGVKNETAPFGSVASPIEFLEQEHTASGDALTELRRLTDNYTTPQHGCASWKALMDGLANLDADLRTHIHKENSILFPRALRLENQN